MPKYMWKVSYSLDGIRGIMKQGAVDRAAQIGQITAANGGTLESFYFAFGETDVYLIVDVPDAAAAVALSMSTSASGAVGVKTIALVTPEEVDEAKTRTVEYRPPGG